MDVYWQKRGVTSYMRRLKRNLINKFESEYENWSPRIGCEEGRWKKQCLARVWMWLFGYSYRKFVMTHFVNNYYYFGFLYPFIAC